MIFLAKYEKKIIFAIIVATFLVSVAYSFHFQIQPTVDARAYDTIAWDLAQGLGYDEDSAIGRPGPGYEFFLGGIYSVFGRSYEAVWIIQALLLAGSAYFTYLIAQLVFKSESAPVIGIAAAALIGFSPDLITISAMLMTETLFIFLTVVAIYFTIKYVDANRWWMIMLAALFLGLAVLTRSNVLFLISPILGFLVYKRKWVPSLLFLMAFILVLTPWTVRNYNIYGEIRPFNAALALIYVGNHPGATGELVLDYPIPEGYENFDSLSQIENDQILRDEGIKYILENPLQFIKLTVWRASIYFSFARPFAFWEHLSGISRLITIIASSLYAGFVFLFGIVGAIASLRMLKWKDKQKAVMLLGMLIILPISVIWLIVETRYRFAIYPALSVFSGGTIYYLWKRREEFFSELKTIILVTVLIFGNTVFDVIKGWNRIRGRL